VGVGAKTAWTREDRKETKPGSIFARSADSSLVGAGARLTAAIMARNQGATVIVTTPITYRRHAMLKRRTNPDRRRDQSAKEIGTRIRRHVYLDPTNHRTRSSARDRERCVCGPKRMPPPSILIETEDLQRRAEHAGQYRQPCRDGSSTKPFPIT